MAPRRAPARPTRASSRPPKALPALSKSPVGVAHLRFTEKVAALGPGLVVGALCVWNPVGYAAIPALPTAIAASCLLVMLFSALRAGGLAWHPVAWCLVAAVATWTISALVSPAPMIGLLGASGRTSGVLSLLLAAVAFVVGLNSGRQARTRPIAVVSIAAGSWCFAAMTLAGRLGLRVVPDPAASRSGGPLGSAAFTGSALALLLPASLIVASHTRNRRVRLVSVLGAVLIVVALVSTGARAAWIGAAIGVIAAFLLLAKAGALSARQVVGVAGAGLAIATVTVLLFGLGARLTEASGGSQTSAGRLALWSGGVHSVSDVLLFGAGPDQQGAVLPRNLPEDFERRFNDTVVTDRAHNELLDSMLGVGIIGTLPLLVALALLVRTFMSGRLDLTGGLLGCGLLAYGVHLLFNFSVPHVGLVAWLIAGIAIGPIASYRRIAQPNLTPMVVVGLALVVPLALDVLADQSLKSGFEAEQRGQLPAAQSAYTFAAEFTPWQPQLHEVLARFRLRHGDAPAALASASDARRTSGDDPTWTELEAQARLATGDFAGAAQQFERLISIDDRNASLYEGLGHSLAAAGRTDEARQAFLRALELNPRRTTATQGIDGLPSAALLDRNGDPLDLTLEQQATFEERVKRELILRGADASKLMDDPSVSITTTLDPAIQTAVNAAVLTVPATEGRFVPAALVSSPRTGEILGLSSTPDDVLSIRRGSGSTLKIAVLLAAARAGIGPETMIDGQKDCVFPTDTGRYDAGAVGTPTRAASPVWMMTAESINCAFARLSQVVGREGLRQAVEDLGLQPMEELGPRFAIGGNSVSAEELLLAMNSLLGDGRVRSLHMISTVTRDGSRIEITDTPVSSVTVSADERQQVLVSLRAVLEEGTARQSHLSGGRPAAGKTGTQPSNTDAWFVGGTPSVAAVVWIGNPNDPTDGMVEVPAFNYKNVKGATIPAVVWQKILDRALAGTSIEELPVHEPPT